MNPEEGRQEKVGIMNTKRVTTKQQLAKRKKMERYENLQKAEKVVIANLKTTENIQLVRCYNPIFRWMKIVVVVVSH